MATSANRFDVYTIIKRGDNEKGWWIKIGSAWLNRDGSYNIMLDALPVNGTLHMREPSPREEKDEPFSDPTPARATGKSGKK